MHSQVQSRLRDKDASAEGHAHAGGDNDVTRAVRHEVAPTDLGAGGDNPLLAITLAKESLLQAQLDQYEGRKPEGRHYDSVYVLYPSNTSVQIYPGL